MSNACWLGRERQKPGGNSGKTPCDSALAAFSALVCGFSPVMARSLEEPLPVVDGSRNAAPGLRFCCRAVPSDVLTCAEVSGGVDAFLHCEL